MRKQKVLSLYDGMACGLQALNRAEVPVGRYDAAEIDKWAMKVAKHNNPELNHIGNVCDIDPKDYHDTDLVIGGSPCQSLSVAGSKTGITTNTGVIVDSLVKYLFLKELGFTYDKSSLTYFNTSCLFWEFVRIFRGIKALNPNVKFLLENVVNSKWAALITREMGVAPYHINSSAVTPQNRDRLYWTDIDYTPIRKFHPTLDEIIPDAVSGAGTRGVPQKNWIKTPENPYLHIQWTTVRKDNIANCLTAAGGKLCRKYADKYGEIHLINIEQAEMLQTVYPGYTDVPGVSENQRFKMLGNGWTVDVIAHFFRCYKLQFETKTEDILSNHY